MLYQSILVVVSLLLGLSIGASREDYYGVGISLTSDYGTASVYFANGSFVDVAKVQGGELYKTYMLDVQQAVTPTSSATARYCPFSQNLCRYWPLQVTQARSPQYSMLKALLAASEVTLGKHIRSALVAASDYNTHHGEYSRDMRSALGELGVASLSGLEVVVLHLVPALDLEVQCNDEYEVLEIDDPDRHVDPPQLILTVEYTGSSMTASIWREQCRNYDLLSRVSTSDFRDRRLLACRNAPEEAVSCDIASLEAAFHMLVKKAGRPSSRALGAVLVHGQKAGDKDLLTALRHVLSESFSNGATVDLSQVLDFSPDAAYVGSRTMAFSDLAGKVPGGYGFYARQEINREDGHYEL